MSMNVLSNLGLVETTTDRQFANGTRQLHDPKTNCSYTLHSSGYIRRILHYNYGSDRYQLNPKRTVSDPCGAKYVERVMVPFSEQLEILGRCVQSYRALKATKK